MKRGERRHDLALDMRTVRVDQLEDHAVPVLGAFQHAAEQHLIDPILALAGAPVLDGAIAVVERKQEEGARAAHAPCGEAGNIAEPRHGFAHPLLDLVADIGAVVDDARHGLQRDARLRCDMLDGDGAAPRFGQS